MRRAAKVDAYGVDALNPNYKGAGVRECGRCGVAFKSYNKTRKYCSVACSNAGGPEKFCAVCGCALGPKKRHNKTCSRACAMQLPTMAPKRELTVSKSGRVYRYNPRPRPEHVAACGRCGQEFRSSPSQKRKFCSYACFVASGGGQRAGDAAIMAKKKYGAKKDANHNEIFDAIAAFTAVKDLSAAGCGVPDGLAWVNDGWQLFDVKNPKTAYGKRGLNERQKKWAEDWRGGPVYLIYSVDEAIKFARGELSGIKKHDSATVKAALEAVGIPFRGVVE